MNGDVGRHVDEAPDKAGDTVLSIVIPTFNGEKLLSKCLDSCRSEVLSLGLKAEILVVDNGSSDHSLDLLKRDFPEVRVVALESNYGFAAACDDGVKSAHGRYCLLLNNDAWFSVGALQKLVEFAIQGDYSFAGPKLLNPDGSLQWAPQSIDFLGDPSDLPPGHEAFLVVGAAILIRRSDYLLLGGFDRRYFAFYEESDLQWRAKIYGLKVGYDHRSHVFHLGGGTLEGAVVRSGGTVTIKRDRLYWARRNQLASVIKNYALKSLIWVLPCWIGSMVVECVGAMALGQRAVVGIYGSAIAWNVRHLPGTLRLRRAIQSRRTVSDRKVRQHFRPPFTRLRTLIGLARGRTVITIR